jgi:hypothetical protein
MIVRKTCAAFSDSEFRVRLGEYPESATAS